MERWVVFLVKATNLAWNAHSQDIKLTGVGDAIGSHDLLLARVNTVFRSNRESLMSCCQEVVGLDSVQNCGASFIKVIDAGCVVTTSSQSEYLVCSIVEEEGHS